MIVNMADVLPEKAALAKPARSRVDKFINFCFLISVVVALVSVFWSYLSWHLYSGVFCSEKMHNFGSVKEHSQLHHTFTIRNLQIRPITITYIGSSCGCTSASSLRAVPIRLQPFQSVGINVSHDTTGENGTVQQDARVFTSDNKEVDLSIRADVKENQDNLITPPKN